MGGGAPRPAQQPVGDHAGLLTVVVAVADVGQAGGEVAEAVEHQPRAFVYDVAVAAQPALQLVQVDWLAHTLQAPIR